MPIVTKEITVEVAPQPINKSPNAIPIHARDEIVQRGQAPTFAIGRPDDLSMLQIRDKQHLSHEQFGQTPVRNDGCVATQPFVGQLAHCGRQISQQLAIDPRLDVEPFRQSARQVGRCDVERGERPVWSGVVQLQPLFGLKLSRRQGNGL